MKAQQRQLSNNVGGPPIQAPTDRDRPPHHHPSLNLSIQDPNTCGIAIADIIFPGSPLSVNLTTAIQHKRKNSTQVSTINGRRPSSRLLVGGVRNGIKFQEYLSRPLFQELVQPQPQKKTPVKSISPLPKQTMQVCNINFSSNIIPQNNPQTGLGGMCLSVESTQQQKSKIVKDDTYNQRPHQSSSKLGSPLLNKNFYGGPIVNQHRGLNMLKATHNMRKGQNDQQTLNRWVPNDKENLLTGVIQTQKIGQYMQGVNNKESTRSLNYSQIKEITDLMTKMAAQSGSQIDLNDQLRLAGSQKVLLQIRPQDIKVNEALKPELEEEQIEKKVLLSTTGQREQSDIQRWNNIITSGSTFENGIGIKSPVGQDIKKLEHQKFVGAFLSGDLNTKFKIDENQLYCQSNAFQRSHSINQGPIPISPESLLFLKNHDYKGRKAPAALPPNIKYYHQKKQQSSTNQIKRPLSKFSQKPRLILDQSKNRNEKPSYPKTSIHSPNISSIQQPSSFLQYDEITSQTLFNHTKGAFYPFNQQEHRQRLSNSNNFELRPQLQAAKLQEITLDKSIQQQNQQIAQISKFLSGISLNNNNGNQVQMSQMASETQIMGNPCSSLYISKSSIQNQYSRLQTSQMKPKKFSQPISESNPNNTIQIYSKVSSTNGSPSRQQNRQSELEVYPTEKHLIDKNQGQQQHYNIYSLETLNIPLQNLNNLDTPSWIQSNNPSKYYARRDLNQRQKNALKRNVSQCPQINEAEELSMGVGIVGQAMRKKTKKFLPKYDKVQYKILFKNEKITSNNLPISDINHLQNMHIQPPTAAHIEINLNGKNEMDSIVWEHPANFKSIESPSPQKQSNDLRQLTKVSSSTDQLRLGSAASRTRVLSNRHIPSLLEAAAHKSIDSSEMKLHYKKKEEDEMDLKIQSPLIGSGGEDISFQHLMDEENNNQNNGSMYDSLEGGCKYKMSRDQQ